MRKSTERALKETVDYIDDIVKIAFEKHCIESHCHYNIDMLQIIELAKICYKPQELENFIVRKNTPASKIAGVFLSDFLFTFRAIHAIFR